MNVTMTTTVSHTHTNLKTFVRSRILKKGRTVMDISIPKIIPIILKSVLHN